MQGAPQAAGASNRLPILAVEINAAHATARKSAGLALSAAIEAGKKLLEAKETVGHSGWLNWLATNVECSDRTAQTYMRLARHADVVDAKSAVAADLTIAGAVAELTIPKQPEKLSERVRMAGDLPPSGHIRVGVRENNAGWDEIWIAPCYPHAAFFYVNHIWTSRDDGTAQVTGTRRPVRADWVAHLIDAHLSCDREGLAWRDQVFPAWTFNRLLYNDEDDYIRTLCATGFSPTAPDVPELAALVSGRPPPDSNPAIVSRAGRGGQVGPLSAIVFASREAAP